MTLKDKLADDFVSGLLPPNRKAAREGWLKGFKAAKILVLHELTGILPTAYIDRVADAGEDTTTQPTY